MACSQAFIESGKKLHQFNTILMVKTKGRGLLSGNSKDGKRCSAAKAYLEPIKHRENLTIYTDMQAYRIIVEDDRVQRLSLSTKIKKRLLM